MQDFEKLGVFYLGREFDLDSGRPRDVPVLYDSRDLVTHAVCVGMTGSGKTGLCLSLIEEAAIDGVPVIAIDPKGDLSNLLLTFPSLAPADFRPWIDDDEARRAGLPADDFAARQAETWRKGLADWGQDGARIERLRQAAEFAIYTPGSRAGLPLSVLSTLAAPAAAVREDGEALSERAANTAISLLSLAGADAEVRSREHTLVSTVLLTAWKAGRDVDLAALIQQVQSPPFQKIGVVDLESFFPSKDRFELAMQFNTVLAAPGFEQWLEGDPLDPSRLLYTADGKPRVSICSIAHLGDAERMFFVSLLLNQMLSWMRAQTGTSSLRALLYMDEIAGYFPPVANPPSKGPLLTMLKQARAFGLGVTLATQNPVDLDYKGLANTGTWFIGRLQTERDKERVLDGLQGAASGSLDRGEVDRLLSALGKRVFLMHNVHEQGPVVFQTRWTLSYLRGPLSRDQIRGLVGPRPAAAPAPAAAPSPSVAPAPASRSASASTRLPVLPPEIPQLFIPVSNPSAATVYSPVIVGAARVSFTDQKLGIDEAREVVVVTGVGDGAVAVDWEQANALDVEAASLRKEPETPEASFQDVPGAAAKPKNYPLWAKAFAQWLARTQKVELLRHRDSKLTSRPGESERDFRIRVGDVQRVARDAAVDALRKKYASKQTTLAERLRRAESAVSRESDQASQQKLQTALSVGASLLGALMGRKAISSANLGRVSTAARGVGRSMKESGDVTRASESVEAVRKQIQDLEDQIRAETQTLTDSFDAAVTLETVTLSPKRGQVAVQFVALGWDPS
jgi:hypothetical protein